MEGASKLTKFPLMEKVRNKIHKIVEIKDMLKDVLEEMECIWLLANSIYERTFVGVKK